MPQADLATLDDTANLECDICIIGSGPAGATIAQELAGTRLNITLLESGGLSRHDATDRLNDIESVGWPRVMDQWLVRNRIVGGTSHTWSGRCTLFNEIDLETRSWVPHSGWPLELSQLKPFLDRSAAYLGLGKGSGYQDRHFWSYAGRRPPKPELNSDALLPCFWQFSRDPKRPMDHMRLGPALLAKLPQNVSLLTNATVLHINVNAAATAVNAVEVASLDGRHHVVHARIVIVCAGGVENARILLASNQTMPTGLGNQHDLVGRFLMDHPRGNVASFQIAGSAALQKLFGHYHVVDRSGGHMYAHGMRLSPQIQQDEQLLNCAAWIAGDIGADDPWNAVRRLLRRQDLGPSSIGRDAMAIASNLGLVSRGLNNFFIEGNGLPHKLDRLNLVCMAEQMPDPNSRVTLADSRDRFGIRHSRIDWRVNEMEHRTVRRMAELVREAFQCVGLPTPILEPWVEQGRPMPDDIFRDVAHPTGTTRMGDDQATSVVDADCQVHGIDGLYVAGSSVFPTTGHANPTQMIVALAIRLADTIKLRLSSTEGLAGGWSHIESAIPATAGHQLMPQPSLQVRL